MGGIGRGKNMTNILSGKKFLKQKKETVFEEMLKAMELLVGIQSPSLLVPSNLTHRTCRPHGDLYLEFGKRE